MTLPKAPAGRMRAALGGVLEEQLLEDDDALHLALPPHAPTVPITAATFLRTCAAFCSFHRMRSTPTPLATDSRTISPTAMRYSTSPTRA